MKLPLPLGLPKEEYDRVKWIANTAMVAFIVVAIIGWIVK